jgi:hypothetical protein
MPLIDMLGWLLEQCAGIRLLDNAKPPDSPLGRRLVVLPAMVAIRRRTYYVSQFLKLCACCITGI